jgi:hypothetical protein
MQGIKGQITRWFPLIPFLYNHPALTPLNFTKKAHHSDIALAEIT